MSNICTCQQPQFFTPRSAFPFDEKAAYIDSIFKVLMESRFGFDCTYESFVQLSDRIEVDVASFHSMIETRLKVFDALASLGHKTFRALASVFQNAEQIVLPNACGYTPNSFAALTPNLGRGSP